MLKTKSGFILRKVMNEYMVVAVGLASDALNGMIRMNEAGSFLWKELQDGITEDDLVGKMMERYEGLDADTARQDLREFLNTIAIAVEEA